MQTTRSSRRSQHSGPSPTQCAERLHERICTHLWLIFSVRFRDLLVQVRVRSRGCPMHATRTTRGSEHSGSGAALWVVRVHASLTSTLSSAAERADSPDATIDHEASRARRDTPLGEPPGAPWDPPQAPNRCMPPRTTQTRCRERWGALWWLPKALRGRNRGPQRSLNQVQISYAKSQRGGGERSSCSSTERDERA